MAVMQADCGGRNIKMDVSKASAPSGMRTDDNAVCFFEDGELHGVMEEWYENGLRMTGTTRKENFTELFGVGIIMESGRPNILMRKVKL